MSVVVQAVVCTFGMKFTNLHVAVVFCKYSYVIVRSFVHCRKFRTASDERARPRTRIILTSRIRCELEFASGRADGRIDTNARDMM